jgi:hypothetical protein
MAKKEKSHRRRIRNSVYISGPTAPLPRNHGTQLENSKLVIRLVTSVAQALEQPKSDLK